MGQILEGYDFFAIVNCHENKHEPRKNHQRSRIILLKRMLISYGIENMMSQFVKKSSIIHMCNFTTLRHEAEIPEIQLKFMRLNGWIRRLAGRSSGRSGNRVDVLCVLRLLGKS